MEVNLKRINDAFHFEATSESGIKVQLDSSPEIGGEGNGVRPMELLLMAAGGCTSIDIGLILKKQKQLLKDYKINITGEKNDNVSKSFKSINFHIELWGDLDPIKVEKAIQLTLTKYCSVVLSLDKNIRIDHSFTIHN